VRRAVLAQALVVVRLRTPTPANVAFVGAVPEQHRIVRPLAGIGSRRPRAAVARLTVWLHLAIMTATRAPGKATRADQRVGLGTLGGQPSSDPGGQSPQTVPWVSRA
jgi:hypothetical protein